MISLTPTDLTDERAVATPKPVAILHIRHPELPQDHLSGKWYQMPVETTGALNRNVKILRRGIDQYIADERWQHDSIARLTRLMPDKPERFYIEWTGALLDDATLNTEVKS